MCKGSKCSYKKFIFSGLTVVVIGAIICSPFFCAKSKASGTNSDDDFDYQAFYEELNWQDEEDEKTEEYPKVLVEEREYGIKVVHKYYENKTEKIVYDKDGYVIFRDVFEY